MLKNKKLLFTIAATYTIVLLYFSLANTKGVIPDTGIEFQDKIFHFGAYLVLAFLWGLFAFSLKKTNTIFYAFTGTFLFGIILELVQEIINPLRTYDVYDLLANCIGVVVGTVFVYYYSNKRKLK